MTVKSQKVLRALVAVVLSFCAVLLSLWAVITEEADANLAINVGKTSSIARVNRFYTYSGGVMQDSFENYVSEHGGRFGSYGTATLRENILSLNRLRVDDRVDFVVDFTDTSSVDIKYRVVLECVNDYYGLFDGLEVKIGSNYINATEYECSYIEDEPAIIESEWATLPNNINSDRISITIKLPEVSAQYSGYGTQISVAVQVVPQT